MRTYRKWVMTLGIIAVTPGVTMAGPLSFLKDKPADGTSAEAAPSARRSNQQVAQNVAQALREAGLKGYPIDIEFKGGVALLTGKCGTPEQKALASEAVSRIPEVKKVDNRLTPIPGRQSETRQVSFEAETPAQPPVQALAQAPAMPTAPSQPSIQPAAAAVDPIETALAESTPAPNSAANQQMAEQIGAALSPVLKGFDVEIRYIDGTCTLAGAVATPQQRAAAEQVVSQIPGVQSVRNRLTYPGAGQELQQAGAQQAYAARQQQLAMAGYQPNGGGPEAAPVPPGAPGAAPYAYAGPMGGQPTLNNPSLPPYAWPSYASYPNYAQVTYPTQYSASAWPYIGPFYPYPQVPLGWRQVQMEWDDGMWNLNFRPRTDKWWWFLSPKNW